MKKDTELTRKKAVQIIRKRLIEQVPRDFEIQDGLSAGCHLYGLPQDEPCWTAWIPSEISRTGPSRIICVSKKIGRIIYDGWTNEE